MQTMAVPAITASDMREQLRSPDARLTILLEGVGTLHERSRKALSDANLALPFERSAVVLGKRRLVVECVDVTHAAAHEQ